MFFRTKTSKVDTERLFQQQEEFQIKLQNRFEVLEDDDMYANITETIQKCTLEVAGKANSKRS